MATKKPRITISLSEREHEVLARLYAVSGEPMSKVVASFVTLAIPSLERVVLLMERARHAPEEVRSGLAAAIDRADRELIPALEKAAGQADLFLADLGVAAERSRAAVAPGPEPGARQAPARARGRRRQKFAGPTPVPVTRGSGSPRGDL